MSNKSRPVIKLAYKTLPHEIHVYPVSPLQITISTHIVYSETKSTGKMTRDYYNITRTGLKFPGLGIRRLALRLVIIIIIIY